MALDFTQILGNVAQELNSTNASNMVNFAPQKIMGGIFATMMAIWLIVIVVMALLFILWIFMIVDVSKRQFKLEHDKIGWILIIVLTGYIGAIVYYFAIKRADKH
jgi:uncharacterized integral membrane protein